MLLVINFGAQYCHLIARRVRDLGVYSEIKPYDITASEIKKLKPKGIILSGGPSSVYGKNAPLLDKKILNLDIPKIKTGEIANLTLFRQKERWTYKDSISFSKSQNTPFTDHPLSSRSVVVINKGKIFKTPDLK